MVICNLSNILSNIIIYLYSTSGTNDIENPIPQGGPNIFGNTGPELRQDDQSTTANSTQDYTNTQSSTNTTVETTETY